MIFYFDTETSGFPVKGSWDHPKQAFLVQFAAILVDEEGKTRFSTSMVIRPPEGRVIPEEVAKIHGITTEIAGKHGIHAEHAVEAFQHCLFLSKYGVAHNIKFDLEIMKLAFAFVGLVFPVATAPKWICTKELSEPILNLPPTEKMIAAGFNKPKAPKLSECAKFFFGEDHEAGGAHDAMADVIMCKRVYEEIAFRKTKEALG